MISRTIKINVLKNAKLTLFDLKRYYICTYSSEQVSWCFKMFISVAFRNVFIINFDVLLTVLLSVFILVINQLDAKKTNGFSLPLYCWRCRIACGVACADVTVSRESDAVTSSTCRTNPPSNETIDVFYIKKMFYNKFISCLYMFRAPCAHCQETATYRCDNTRGCIIQFWPPDEKHMVLQKCRGMKWTYCKTNFVHQVG